MNSWPSRGARWHEAAALTYVNPMADCLKKLSLCRSEVQTAAYHLACLVNLPGMLCKSVGLSSSPHYVRGPQIGHAGEGGIYAELIQDRSFDALAFTTGFLDSPAQTLPLTAQMIAPSNLTVQRPTSTNLSALRADVAKHWRMSDRAER